MIGKNCSVVTDSEGLFGLVHEIDEAFIYIQIKNLMVAIPLLRVKSITYKIEDELKIEDQIEVDQTFKIKKDFDFKVNDSPNPFLDKIKKKLETPEFKDKLNHLNIVRKDIPQSSSSAPNYKILKGKDDFIQNKKS